MSVVIDRIEERWGFNFWLLVKDFADQGLTRIDTARAMGATRQWLYRILWANPLLDPFEPVSTDPLVSAWIKDTGETFGDACRRMARQGWSLTRASREFGFTSTNNMKAAMRRRGIEVEFPRGYDLSLRGE